MTSHGIQGITEDDIANYLAQTPGFFERHAELLSSVQLASPHGHRAVSLQQRQMEMLRERIKGLERRIMEMIRHAQENASLADRLHAWTRAIMLVDEPREVPEVLLAELAEQFLIPATALRVWDVAAPFADEPFALGTSEDLRSFADSLHQPYCGANTGFEAVHWLADADSIASVALIPLRLTSGAPAFGLLALGSPDPTRYSADMGTDLLARIGELASAGLARLLPISE
jgi:uncharacterized protein YigA (DUF484 family)